MTITAATPLATSNFSVALISPLVSTEMMLSIEPRSASEARVSGAGASAVATFEIAIALNTTETANHTKMRRTGHRRHGLLEVVDRVQLARPVDAERGVGVERALEVREPAGDVLVEVVAQEQAQARDLDVPREPAVTRADGQDGRQLVGDLQRRAEALEQVRQRDRRGRRDVDHERRAGVAPRRRRQRQASPCGTVPECSRPWARLSCSRDRRGNGSVDPCPHRSCDPFTARLARGENRPQCSSRSIAAA